jgi:hypothetical protein
MHSDVVTSTFRKALLLVFHRDNHVYEWASVTPNWFVVRVVPCIETRLTGGTTGSLGKLAGLES